MRRLLRTLPSLLLLAACGGGGPPSAGPPQPHMTASFPRGAVVDVIRIDVLDRQPLRAAALIAPDGAATPASTLNVDANPEILRGQNAIGDPWRASMFGSNGANPLPSGGMIDPGAHGRNELLMIVSTAEIALPDPVAYRRDWANYRIRLSFPGAGDQLEAREIPAPEPPPERPGG